MARKKIEVLDDDGNEFPPPEPGSPVAQIIYLLEYGRKRGFQIGPEIQVGDVHIQALDLNQLEAAQRSARSIATVDDAPVGSDMHILRTGEE